MKHGLLLWGKAKTVGLALVGWMAIQSSALAQPPANKSAEGGSYVLPYAIVIFGIALGLLFVLRSSHRRERAKPEQYEDQKAALKE